MGDVIDRGALVRCRNDYRGVMLGDCLTSFEEDEVNAGDRSARTTSCSRCPDGRRRHVQVERGVMPQAIGMVPGRKPVAPGAAPLPVPALPQAEPAPVLDDDCDDDCDDGNPCTEEAAAPAPAAPPTPTATTTATTASPAPPDDALRDLTDAARALAGAARELAGLLRAVGRLRLAGPEAPPARTPAPPTVATPTATAATRAPATDAPLPDPGPVTLHWTVKPDSPSSRVIRAANRAEPLVLRELLREWGVGANRAEQMPFWRGASWAKRMGYIKRLSMGVYQVTPLGRRYAAALELVGRAA